MPTPSPADKPLTARQQRFVDLMLHEDNAAEAARRAGYRPLAAKHTARKLLARPNVQAALEAGRDARTAPLTRDTVLEELRAIAFSNLLDYVAVGHAGQRLELDLSKLTRAQAAGFRELTVDETWKAGTHRRQIRVRMGAKVFALSRLLGALERLEGSRLEGAPPARETGAKDLPEGDRRAAKVSPTGDRRATGSPPPGHRRSQASL
ncbi:MAG: hypothetical protein JWR84_4106 [Caulobacter sp.]|nr:hypothetical protein [Caulobacter sp.]